MKIKTVCRFQDFLLRQFFCVADPVIEGILATFVSSFFCFASGSDRYILLITVYVLPPFMVIPDLHALTEIFDSFQIFRVLKNVLLLQFFLRASTFSLSSPDKVKACELNSQTFDQKLSDAQTYLDASRKLQHIWEEKEQHNKEQQEYLDKIGLEISRMKEGSIALVNQITTISKIRIFDPRNLKGVLSGISLSEENMEKINKKMKKLYIFEK